MKIPEPVKLQSGQYRIQLRLNGKSVVCYGATKAECKNEAARIKAEHVTGNTVQKRCDYTTAQAIDKYIADRNAESKKLSPATVRGYEIIKRTRFPSAMNKKIDSVDWKKVVASEQCSPKTLRNAWGLVSAAMRNVGITPPALTLPEIVTEEHPFLQPEQIPVFQKAIEGSPVELAALLGLHSLRRSEIYDLMMDDIDLDNGTIRVKGAAVLDKSGKLVHKKENKNKTSTRTVPIMIPRLKELLTELKAEGKDGYLVDYYTNRVYKLVNAACKNNNLPEIGCHGLRHSFVSLAYHLGWDELTTMRIAGYSDINTMRRIYTHLAESDKNKNIDKMAQFFAADNQATTTQ